MNGGADASDLPRPGARRRPPLEVLTLPPGQWEAERPVRNDVERTLYVVEGQAELILSGARRQLQPGDAVIVPAGVAYRLRATGPRSTTLLHGLAPAGREPAAPPGRPAGAHRATFH